MPKVVVIACVEYEDHFIVEFDNQCTMKFVPFRTLIGITGVSSVSLTCRNTEVFGYTGRVGRFTRIGEYTVTQLGKNWTQPLVAQYWSAAQNYVLSRDGFAIAKATFKSITSDLLNLRNGSVPINLKEE